jgi:hypothetical protein
MRLEDGIGMNVIDRGTTMENQVGIVAEHLIVVSRQPQALLAKVAGDGPKPGRERKVI